MKATSYIGVAFGMIKNKGVKFMLLSREELEALAALDNGEDVKNSNVLIRLGELGLVRGLKSVGSINNSKAVIVGLETELTVKGKEVLQNKN